MILPITLTIAAAAALLNIWLGWRVSRVRLQHKVSIGDAGNPQLIARMRAHANYAEYTPFFLVLLAAVELARGAEWWLWAVAILYILARVAHAFGMDRTRSPNLLRSGGIVLSWLALIGLAGAAIWIASVNPATGTRLPLPAGRSASL